MEKKCGNILVIIFSSDHLCGYYNEPNLPNFKSSKYMRSLWTKWSEHIEVWKKKRLLLIEAKKKHLHKCCFIAFPLKKYIFREELDSPIERYVAVEMKMNTVLRFSPP